MKLTKEMLKRVIREELEAVTERCWDGYERVPGTKAGASGSCRKKGSVNEEAIEEKKKKAKKMPQGGSQELGQEHHQRGVRAL